MKRELCVVLAMLTSGGLAFGQEGGEELASGKNMVTISMSPIHLIFPMLELDAEFKAHPRIGVGLILAGGRVSNEDKTITATGYEVGGQVNYYILKPFAGLHVGVEGLYLSLGDVMQDATATGSGFSIGPYVGYKVQTDLGFAFIAQGGVSYLAVRAESSSAMASDSKVSPLLNLNIGWSF
jgi:hypothetical protein